jgi:DNA-binding SARP family transcriptional activator
MLDVSMLGRMSITSDEGRVTLTFGPRGRLLAGYLFQFPDRAHRREFLVDLFWQDVPEQQARAAMNTALWRLRKVLALDSHDRKGRCLCSTGDEIVLERKPWMRIDTHSFDEAVRPALGSRDDGDDACRAGVLEGAAARYGGAFLDGDGEDWVIAERERLHALYVRSLCELMRIHAAHGDYESAISAARRVLAVDQFRETVMRALAILLVLNGQRAEAIDALTRWQLALRKQVGVGPVPETLELRAALVSGSICQDLDGWRRRHLATPAATQRV